jgi:hypothetical protein
MNGGFFSKSITDHDPKYSLPELQTSVAVSRRLPTLRGLGVTLPSAILAKRDKTGNYFSQLCVHPFLLGHKLQSLIEKRFFLGFPDGLGVVSTRISAG